MRRTLNSDQILSTGGEPKGAGILGAIVTSIRTMPWGSLEHVFLLIVGILLTLVSWRLYGATNKYVEAAKNIAAVEETQGKIIKEQTNAVQQYVKDVQDLINLERLRFLDQLEFFYQNRPDEIKPRFGLDSAKAEDNFISRLIESRMKLSVKVFDDIVRASMTQKKRRG